MPFLVVWLAGGAGWSGGVGGKCSVSSDTGLGGVWADHSTEPIGETSSLCILRFQQFQLRFVRKPSRLQAGGVLGATP